MRKLFVLSLCFIIFYSSCKKEEPTVNTNDHPINVMKDALAGKWYWEKTEHYEGGAVDSTYDSITDPTRAGEYIDFKSDIYTGILIGYTPPGIPLYDLYSGNNLSTSSLPSYWGVDYFEQPSEAPLKYLYSNHNYYIKTLTSTDLVLTDWSGDTPTFGMKCYYHR